MKALNSSTTKREPRLNFLLRELQRVVKPGSIIALITDFIGSDDETLEILSALARHNDINLFWIHDESETRAWARGYYPVLVDGRKFGFTLDGSKSDDWLLQSQQQHRIGVETLGSRLNLPLIPVCCNRDISRQILQALSLT